MAIPSFVDQVTLHVYGGHGGNGCASIHREKFKPLGGPDGGNGGDDTLFALVAGHVEFGTRRGRRVVNVTPTASDSASNFSEPVEATSAK